MPQRTLIPLQVWRWLQLVFVAELKLAVYQGGCKQRAKDAVLFLWRSIKLLLFISVNPATLPHSGARTEKQSSNENQCLNVLNVLEEPPVRRGKAVSLEMSQAPEPQLCLPPLRNARRDEGAME